MRKNILSILLTLCLVLALLPSTALATPHFVLTVGNTDVSSLYEGNWDDTTVHYWKAAESGAYAYTNTGSADDYLFSVSLDSSGDGLFTLTLNGVNITGSQIDENDYGISSNTSLNIVLVNASSNSVSINGDGVGYGVLASGTLSVQGNGSLTVTGSDVGSQTGICGFRGVTIADGEITVSNVGWGITSNIGAVTVAGGQLTAIVNERALSASGSVSVTANLYRFRTNTSAASPGTPYTLSTDTAFTNSNYYKYVEIIPPPEVYVSGDNTDSGTVKVSGVTDSANISYWLNDGSGSITSTGASAESYNVKYNEATQTLTLKGATITSYHSDNMGEHQYGIYAQSDLNIVLEGSSVIGTTDTPVGTTGIQCGGNLSLSADSGGSLSIVSEEYGIDAHGSVSINGGTVSISAEERLGITSTGGFSLIDGAVSINSGETGIEAHSDIAVTGAQTTLTVTACTDTDSVGYGIVSSNSILITDAAVSITKNGNRGDAVRARDDIRISGSAGISIVDWSTSDGDDCGLHSNNGSVAVGGSAQVDICSRRIGIYARESVYLGYVWNGSAYAASGSPTVTINDSDSVAVITPETANDFVIGVNGIKTSNGGISMASGTLTAVGSEKALYFEAESLMLPSSYKYKSNTEASAPDGNYTFGTYTTCENDKYVEIVTSQAPSGGYYSPSHTITVTETSSGLLSGAQGAVRAEANMTNAFSSSVEVKVTDTDENASGFGLGIGNTVYPFDISLYIKGTDTKTEPKDGYAVTISLPIPDDLLDMKEQLSIAHKADDGTVTTLVSQLRQIDSVWYLVFEATEFSPYALVANSTGAYNETAGLPYYMDSEETKVFIGFAANGKYIAPEGETISVMQNDKSFTDVAEHWAASYIGFTTERELFFGTGGNAFTPDSGMTRAMFATVIGRLYERSFGEITAATSRSFTDCSYDDYYGKYVDWAAENGIILGVGGGMFHPDRQVTRQEMATILYRFAEFIKLSTNLSSGAALNYSDASSIASWAKDAALYCQEAGIITGRNGGSFAPTETASRAEVAAIIQRYVELALN